MDFSYEHFSYRGAVFKVSMFAIQCHLFLVIASAIWYTSAAVGKLVSMRELYANMGAAGNSAVE